ncbi:copper amine oxidase N-terminal domain-containing protein [Paenibacillus cisolokensis]|uniref:copper amine oxidase N-terminal domain-containing protein n=1 Tax=Paenibacillus cisolokensis TaxID=1658519 RepID=UPI003D2A5A63
MKRKIGLLTIIAGIAVLVLANAAFAREYLFPKDYYISMCSEDPDDQVCFDFCEDFPDEVICSGEAEAPEEGEQAAQERTSESKSIVAAFNPIHIKVNGEEFASNHIVHEGTTYLPIRALAELLELDVHYYEATQSAYIGMLPAGEVPDEVVESWFNAPQETAQAEPPLAPETKTIDVLTNLITVKVHAMELADSNFLYEGTTYVPMRAACEILELPVHYNDATQTAYIGNVPAGEVPVEVYNEWFPEQQ